MDAKGLHIRIVNRTGTDMRASVQQNGLTITITIDRPDAKEGIVVVRDNPVLPVPILNN